MTKLDSLNERRRHPVLITGGHGMLGGFLQDSRSWKPSRQDLPCDNRQAVFDYFEKHAFSAVVHMAALTDLEECERNPHLAWQSTVKTTENILEACQQHQTPLILISTSGVLSGSNPDPQNECTPPWPLNTYAQTKKAAEDLVLASSIPHWVVRIGWLFGGMEQDSKFIGMMTRKIRSLLTPSVPSPSLSIVEPSYGSLLYAPDLYPTLWHILRNPPPKGIYHIANEGKASRLEIAKWICDHYHAEHIALDPVGFHHFPKNQYRPQHEVLDTQKQIDLDFPSLRSWQSALQEYLQDWDAQILPQKQVAHS